MNRLSAILDPDIGWTTDSNGTILVHTDELKCGCSTSWWLHSLTLRWVPSIDWICEGHARVTK